MLLLMLAAQGAIAGPPPVFTTLPIGQNKDTTGDIATEVGRRKYARYILPLLVLLIH